MLDESKIDYLVNTLTGFSFAYSGVSFSPDVHRGYEDIVSANPIVVVDVIPTSRKMGMSLNAGYLSKRTNEYYRNYAYAEADHFIVRAGSTRLSGIDGRTLARHWISGIETYIKRNWNDLITGGSLDYYSFTHRSFMNPFVKRQYCIELEFDVWSTNSWHDEPDTGARTEYPVSGIRTVSGVEVWVSV